MIECEVAALMLNVSAHIRVVGAAIARVASFADIGAPAFRPPVLANLMKQGSLGP